MRTDQYICQPDTQRQKAVRLEDPPLAHEPRRMNDQPDEARGDDDAVDEDGEDGEDCDRQHRDVRA